MCAYAAASDVAALCRNLLGPEMSFSTSTSPPLSDVTRWLGSGCAIIETQLRSLGYTVPPPNTSSIYGWLSELNALYGAARAEMSRTNVVLGPGERTRGMIFEKMFWDGLGRLGSMELSGGGSGSGLTISNAGGGLWGGGIWKSDKDAYEDNTDRVKPRFRRGMFTAPSYESTPTSACDDDW